MCDAPKQDAPHKRRVRYKGTHPTKFHEKYKEANPEKYADTIEKVISKGSTPAGMHISIMVSEILEILQIQPGQQGLDATLGYGGHTKAMLKKLQGQGHIVALDVDPIEIVKTGERLQKLGYGKEILTIYQKNFAKVKEVAKESGKFDFVLADLGVSSMQIDNPERGFSYKTDAPLDLRLDPLHGESAADRLRHMTEEEFVCMLVENSDEPYAESIAAKVFDRKRKGNPVRTTFDLRNAVEEAVIEQQKKDAALAKKTKGSGKAAPSPGREEVKKSCARVFQALRIDVNSEFEVLYEFLESLPDILNPGGRVAILTFHSGEDRLVKKAFKQGLAEGIYSEIAQDVIRPGQEECLRNPRAKSTKLRYAIKA